LLNKAYDELDLQLFKGSDVSRDIYVGYRRQQGEFIFPSPEGLTEAQIEVAMRDWIGSHLTLIAALDRFDQPRLRAELYR
jgi:hypothetical protein